MSDDENHTFWEEIEAQAKQISEKKQGMAEKA